MTEFVYKPYDRIYVRDMVELGMDNFIDIISELDTHAYWADGILFTSFGAAESEELAKKQLEGQMYIERVIFTRYNDYSETVKSTRNMSIVALDVRSNDTCRELVAWIKSQKVWDAKPPAQSV